VDKLLTQLKESINNHRGVCLVTITKSPIQEVAGKKLLVWEDGSIYSQHSLPPPIEDHLIRNCLSLLHKSKSKTIEIVLDDYIIECFVDVYPAPPHLIIAGAGHVCEPVAKLGAMLDFYVTVIDDRPEFANDKRFPEADEVICDSFLTYFHNVKLTNNTYILLLTRGHKYDVFSLQELLERTEKPAYIGMIGSRRRIAGVFEQLRSDFPEQTFEHIYTPVGLDIGAETPAEIAVSIMAEILKIRNNRSGDSLYCQTRPLANKGFMKGAKG
jgi:xanthine dehydrogenase accessory factor